MSSHTVETDTTHQGDPYPNQEKEFPMNGNNESTLGSRPLRELYDALASGALDRREFMRRVGALGVASGFAGMLAGRAGAQTPDASPGATPEASPIAIEGVRPEVGTEGQERGAGGLLRVVIWQAPSSAAPHSALSDKDYLAAAPVIEPILHYLPDGSLIPNLVEEVPSVENGLLSEDLLTADFVFLEGLLWSDGEPVTADDLVFTWEWVMTPSNAANSAGVWEVIESIEAVDERTARVTFKRPSVIWFEPFSGNYDGNLYPAHVFGNDPANKNEAFLSAPIGTGPYVMETFTPNDAATYVVNENYREPNKPFFSRIQLKGGGDAAAAARAVLQTGDFDYAWNLQVEPAVLEEMEGTSELGQVYGAGGTTVESINFNFSDPRREVDGQRSHKDTEHPIFSDLAVRQALNVAVPRQLIADELYGDDDRPTSNVLAGLELFESPNTSWTYDLDEANRILDEAGWVRENGGVRSKDGVELAFDYWTSITPVRQQTQAVVKQEFEKIGARVEINSVDAGIFFSAEAGNDQNFYHMFWDMDMWTNGPYSPIPISWMNRWYAGPDGSNLAQEENGWQLDNTQRYQNPAYDALYEELLQVTDTEQAIDMLIQLNDMLIADVVEIPIVNRSVGSYALNNRIRNENIATGPSFVLPFWNIANWNMNVGFEPL
jgi:peptide/nickel transport system substrate-binding protein